jgi:hypothetical protein
MILVAETEIAHLIYQDHGKAPRGATAASDLHEFKAAKEAGRARARRAGGAW